MEQISIFGKNQLIKKKSVIEKYNDLYHAFKPKLKIISLGAGLQSTVLYYMSSMGIIDKVDYAVFADTGAEEPYTYRNIEYLQNWQKNNNGIPLIICNKENLNADLLSWFLSTGQRFASVPFFSNKGKSQLPRQCTSEYKIKQVDKKIRELLSLKKFQRNKQTEIMIGFTIDEMQRMNIAKEKWKKHSYPFLELKMTRQDCSNWLIKNNLLVPGKSSCYFCPYKSDAHWIETKKNNPKVFKQAVEIDKAIRDSSKRGIKDKIYLHRDCKPLDEVKFKNEDNLNMCESGYCHL